MGLVHFIFQAPINMMSASVDFWANRPLPAVASLYVIVNRTNPAAEVAYIGKANNIRQRFEGRWSALRECGFRGAVTQRIDIYLVSCHGWSGGVGMNDQAPFAWGIPPLPINLNIRGYLPVGVIPPAPWHTAAVGFVPPVAVQTQPNLGNANVTLTVDAYNINVELMLAMIISLGNVNAILNVVNAPTVSNQALPGGLGAAAPWAGNPAPLGAMSLLRCITFAGAPGVHDFQLILPGVHYA